MSLYCQRVYFNKDMSDAAVAGTSAVAASDNLAALESLMAEFFSPTTSNSRKREIEALLSGFEQQEDAWRSCLDFMTRTSSQFVCMFALNTLENIIHRRWIGLPGHQHAEIRNTLSRFLSEHYKSAPAHIRNKLIKLLVDIARTDWPHFFPDFFPNMLGLIHSPETMLLGLNMLLIASEELATPREDLATSRKEELKKLLTGQVPQVLSTLSDILSSVLDKQKRPLSSSPSSSVGGTSTPPPSPSHTSSAEDAVSMFTTSPVQDGSLLHVASHKLLNRAVGAGSSLRLAPLDSDAEEVSAMALQCLAHLFTWVPLSAHIGVRLLNIVFNFASLGATPSSSKTSSSQEPNGVSPSNTNLGILAMGAINELMCKNCVPVDFENFLLQMFRSTFQLLQTVVHVPSGSIEAPGARINTLDEVYVDKLTEFLRSFVGSHLRRFEGNPQFPVLEFLALLFKFTFLQSRLESYFSCLDAWGICVDYIALSVAAGSRKTDEQLVLARYQEALLALATEIINRLQFKNNQRMLEEIDDSSLDDDDETEWQQYLRISIETVMKVAELMPNEVLRMLYVPWKETCQIYSMLDKHVTGEKLNISGEQELRQLQFMLRDFSTLLQLLGRVSSLFIGECFLTRIQEGNELIRQLIAIASYSSRIRFYSLQVPLDIAKEFIDVQAQTLAALKAWCHWLANLHTVSLKNPTYETQCRELTTGIMVAAAAVIREGNRSPSALIHSASHFMVTLTGTVRPPSIWKVKEFTDLYDSVHQLDLPAEDNRLMVRALANVLLLHWPGLSDQRWDERQKHLSKFLRDITVPFRKIRTTEGFATDRQLQVKAQDVITQTLRILGDLVENILNEITQTKKLCYDCMREFIDVALWLFPIYVADAKVCEVLFNFFHTVFDVLKSQMGAEAVEQAIQTFLALFTKELLAESILNEGGAGIRVVESFLVILEFIVKEPNASFRKFIPSTISLCLEHIYPLVAEKPSADIKGPLYSLLFNVLLYNQRHFFKPSVVRSLGAPSGGHEEVLNRAEFLSIMQAFGQSFMQTDIAIFQQNLASLEQLNVAWKLYHKAVFAESLIEHFLTVLLQVLVSRTHDLLREEIMTTVFNMASVDFGAFFNQFLAQFLERVEDVDQNQRTILKSSFKTDTDLPSFTNNVNRFVNDLRYYKLCNASLPAGSVKF